MSTMMANATDKEIQTVESPLGVAGGFPDLMTEDELIAYLRIVEVSKAEDPHHAVEHLKRMRGLPCIHVCKQPLYPLVAIRTWIQREVEREMK